MFFDVLVSLLNKSIFDDLTVEGLFWKAKYLLLDFPLSMLQRELGSGSLRNCFRCWFSICLIICPHYVFLVEIASWYLFGSELCQNTWFSLSCRKSFTVKTLDGEFCDYKIFLIIIFKKRASRPFVRFILNFSQKWTAALCLRRWCHTSPGPAVSLENKIPNCPKLWWLSKQSWVSREV